MAQKTKPVQISAYVDPNLKKQVIGVAERERRSLSVVIVMIIEKFMHDGGTFGKA